ncbi:MAG: NUDIX domain-containing protein, partial [Acinetobacter baumannii]|nr:NUDIX domain-containing protein [Acinetobacter baumannii]
EAAIRETLEETGHHIDIDALLGIYTYTPPMFPDRTYYRFCFLAHVTHVESDPKLDTGIVSAVWMTLDELKESARARSPLVIKAIEDAMKGQHYPLALIYEHPFSPSLTSHLDA